LFEIGALVLYRLSVETFFNKEMSLASNSVAGNKSRDGGNFI
jgi:hypothetical protein